MLLHSPHGPRITLMRSSVDLHFGPGHDRNMTLYEPCAVQMKKMLSNLQNWLNKGTEHAEAKKFSPDNYLAYRFAPDQFTFLRQIQATCDTAKFAAARLTGKEAPSHPDDEKTWDEVKARVAKTLEYLDTFSEADFEGAEDRTIKLPFAPGQGAQGKEYFHSFAQPNFYFHVTMSYAMLRHAGVELGKIAYIGSMKMEPIESAD